MKDINVTTMATYETGEKERYSTLAVGEEGGQNKPIEYTTLAVGEDGKRREDIMTIALVGEEGVFLTGRAGEQGDDSRITTHTVGEEGDASTLRVGEEGDDNIRDIPPINNDYHMLLVLIKQLLDKIRRNIGIGVGINPSPIAQDPIISGPPPVKGRPVPGQNYTDSMPRSMSANNSTRIEHAYLPEAE